MEQPAADAGLPAPNAREFTVSDLSNAIKKSLESTFGFVRLRGEISGFRGVHSSGHCYFALKDDKARIEAVIWRGVFGKLSVKPREGLEVVVEGRLSAFPGSSKYQIVIERLTPAGVGALMALLEERKRKYAAQGLFDAARKKPLPFWPRVVGIVTSPTGAVIRDMLHGFRERCPTHVLVWPVRVQGETSAIEVAAAIRGFNALRLGGPVPRPDLLIVARGGGSLEDLWGFNEEAVVLAAAASDIPLIAAVGHETDWTLIDLAADARAPTPTKAAEWAAPKHADLIDQTAKFALRLRGAVRRECEGRRALWRAAARGLPRAADIVALPRQRLDAIDSRLGRTLTAAARAGALRLARVSSRFRPRLLMERRAHAAHTLELLARRSHTALRAVAAKQQAAVTRLAGRLGLPLARARMAPLVERLRALSDRCTRALDISIATRRGLLAGRAQMLASLGYRNVLRRGFVLPRNADGTAIRSAAAIRKGDRLDLEFADGRVAATAMEDGGVPPAPTPTPRAAKAASRTSRSRTRGRDQGSLF